MYFWLTAIRLLHCSNCIYQRVVTRVPDGVSGFVLSHKAVSQNKADNAMISTPATDRGAFEGGEPDDMTQSVVLNSIVAHRDSHTSDVPVIASTGHDEDGCALVTGAVARR